MTRQIFKPREYQNYIVDHQLNIPRGNTWAGMGLGKTVSTLTALDHMFLSGYETKPALVCAPLRVAQNTWPDEAAKWDHLRNIEVQPILGSETMRRRALRSPASVYTINYENIPWLIEHLDGRWPFGRVIADESTKLKGFRVQQGTKRARSLARVAHSRCTGWVNLTGTPSPNGLQDLWGQNWFNDAGERLGRSYDAFQQRWFQRKFDGYGLEPLAHAQAEIQAKLGDITLSLNAADYFDIAQPIKNVVYVDLPGRARQLYDEMEARMFMEIEGHGIEAFNAASRTIKCLQIANGAAYLMPDTNDDGTINAPTAWKEIHNAKLDALEDIIEEAAGMPVMVAYHFRSDLERLKKAFPKGKHLDKDPQTIRDWNAGKIPVMFTHPQSAGHGLNLQDGGNIVVFFGHWWDLEQYMQIIERIGPVRQMQAGHNRPVFIYYIVARDTMDEVVMQRRDDKREVQDLLLEAMNRKKG